ncbi:MAG: potassium channel family protein [Fimbriiglobus sp.]
MKRRPRKTRPGARGLSLRRLAWLAVRFRLPRRFARSLLIPAALLAAGTVGYPLIEGEKWDLFDGFYMTAITLTTIGYGEIPEPLSRMGRVFTVVLAYGGIFTLGYFATEIVRSVVTGELQEFLGRQQMEEDLAGLADHTIVCGLGRMGKIVCDELEREGRPFVIIDTAVPVPGEWPYQHGLRLFGNATDDHTLKKAGIDRARALITAVGSDADNLYITLSARLLAPKLTIIARAEEQEAEAKLLKVGATKVVSPYIVGGHRAVQAVLRPTAMNFLEMTTRAEFVDLQLEEVRIAVGCQLAWKSFRDSRLGHDLGVIVIGLLRPTGDMLYNPPGDTVMEPGGVLIALGQRRQLDRLEIMAGATPPA